MANAGGVNPARVADMADAPQGTRFGVACLSANVRGVTGIGLVQPPVVGSRLVDQQLADANTERRFEDWVRVVAERLYPDRVTRGRAELEERVAARRAPEAAPSPPVLPVGESPGGFGAVIAKIARSADPGRIGVFLHGPGRKEGHVYAARLG